MTTIYTKNGCPQCKMTKKIFNQSGIDFEEINLDEHPEYIDKVKELGYKAAPVIVTPCGKSWSGFRIDQIRQLATLVNA